MTDFTRGKRSLGRCPAGAMRSQAARSATPTASAPRFLQYSAIACLAACGSLGGVVGGLCMPAWYRRGAVQGGTAPGGGLGGARDAHEEGLSHHVLPGDQLLGPAPLLVEHHRGELLQGGARLA